MKGWYRDFPYIPFPHICNAILIINIPHHSGTSATTNEPTLTHHPPSPVYIRVQSCCCTFCGFAPIDNDSVLKIKLLIRISALKKSSVLCLFIPPSSLDHLQILIAWHYINAKLKILHSKTIREICEVQAVYSLNYMIDFLCSYLLYLNHFSSLFN